jgi:xanthine dehydrogenase accessory factor
MTDLERILPLWRELHAADADFVLATVVEVQGSSYRKPGAFMLLAPDGRRAGTVSGGCLEAQVASRAWWLTADGPTIQQYSTLDEDGDRPYGSGCGGVLFLLLERRQTANPLLAAIDRAFDQRIPLAIATVLEGPQIGLRAFPGLDRDSSNDPRPFIQSGEQASKVSPQKLAELALVSRESQDKRVSIDGAEVRAWAHVYPARPGLRIFGAGDDAKPLLRIAKELGWFVTVSDGRSQLATRERFPTADEVCVLPANELSAGLQSQQPTFRTSDAAVIMTHSFPQDARILASLLALETPPSYIGVLGPQRRTRELLAEVARTQNLPEVAANSRIDEWLSQLHAPMGLDLGAESSEMIAFSIIAEIQQCLTSSTALPLPQVRSTAQRIQD